MNWRGAFEVWAKTLSSPITAATMVVFAVICTVSGAFGSGADPDLVRRGFWWAVVVVFAVLVGTLAKAVVQVILRPRQKVVEAVLIALISAWAVTPVLVWLSRILYPRAGAHVPDPKQMFWFVLISVLCVSTVRMTIEHSMVQPAEPAAPSPPDSNLPGQPALLRRLDAALHGPLVRIEADDHYVQVHTRSGSARLLMRLGDALEEVAPAEGLRVHRKHWVACDAIRAVVREAGKLWLHLHDGAVVPVSKSYQEAVVRLDLPSGNATELVPVSTASASAAMRDRSGA